MLGAVFISDQALPAIIEEGVTGDCFYRERHRIIFEAMLGLQAAGFPVDVLTVTHRVHGKVPEADVDCLAGMVPNVANVRRHAAILVELTEWRAVQAAALELLTATDARDTDRRSRAWNSLLSVHRERALRAGRILVPESAEQLASVHVLRRPSVA